MLAFGLALELNLVGNYVYKYIDDVFVKLKDAFISTTTANDLSLFSLSLSLLPCGLSCGSETLGQSKEQKLYNIPTYKEEKNKKEKNGFSASLN